MNNRIKKLREESLEAINTLNAERAVLVTRFYKSNVARGLSVPVQRGMNFKYMPEIYWQFSYPVLIAVMFVMTLSMVVYMKTKKWF